MALEIERRFLVKGEGWRQFAKPGKNLQQGYLVTSDESWTVRIRIFEKEKAWLTLKKPSEIGINHEFEYLIPLNDAESLWELTPHKITKTRYELTIHGGSWIVDCFEGSNSPLVLAEVEITSLQEIISQPDWCFKEVTGEYQWSNAGLAQNPISNWPKNLHPWI